MAGLVPVALPGRSATRAESPALRIPVWSLLLLGAAALVISVAGIPRNPVLTAVLLAGGLGLIGVFLVVDRDRSARSVSVLPPTAFRAGPLKWIYLTLGLLMAATMADMYVPLFGQRLAHLEPLVAGFLGVTLAVGWTTGELVSASVERRRAVVRVVAVAPLVMAIGLGSAALSMRQDAPVGVTIGWALALMVTGTGIGMAWPHLSAWAMGAVQDPSAEGATAAAAINTVQLICGAFGAGVAGVIVNAQHDDVTAARWMFAVFAALAAVTAVASYRATRPAPQSGSSSS
jgi:hypothetical protein